MGTESSVNVLTLGGKDSYLSSSSVYSISNNLAAKVKIDSSALDKLSSSSTRPISLSTTFHIPNPNPKPRFLTSEESRAILIVLLNKLIRTSIGIRPVLPQFISETLNKGFPSDALDFGSVSGFLVSLLGLNGTTIEDIGVTDGELAVLNKSIGGLEGISAILEHSCSTLLMVADGIAALSCEASKADVLGVFKFLDSGDGLSNKDEASVASDLKVLLVGSKLVGRVESSVISEIPEVHGGFRKICRSLHLSMRSTLNSTVLSGKELVPEVNGLAYALLLLGKNSLSRKKLTCDSITDVELRSKILELFERNCPTLGSLKDVYSGVMSALSGEDYTTLFHEVCSLLVKVREVVAWEGAVALVLLEINESSEKPKGGSLAPPRVEVNGGKVNQDKKSDKKKKVVLGKGTALVRQLIKDRLEIDGGELGEHLETLKKWAGVLSLFFDPKDSEIDIFLKKLKETLESNETRRLPKLPKGTRDFAKEQMTVREKAFSIIQKVFKRHGATALDTPVFEMRETLMGKYGEDSKLIYDLADQGGELCSLRYDLTVPFARYVAMNGLTSFKRFQIAKVYRRDNPSKGRYREFYQCDFDIAGNFEKMGPDFEVVKVLTELLDELEIGDFEIKLNHRKLLDGMLEICGVSADKFRTICSSIDKLDKQPFEQIKKEMVEEKGLAVEVADKIGSFVKKRGSPLEILAELKQEGSQFLKNEGSVTALNELEILFKALDKSKCIHRVVFDLSLARGLDYYTGVIFEAVFKGTTEVGSIAAGGRYDNLIGMFGTKQVAAIGVSLGIERVFTIMEQLVQNQVVRATETQVLVGILGDDLSQAAELVSELWKEDVKAEYMVHKKVQKMIERALDSKIPYMVIMGERERTEGIVKLKNIETKEERVVARDTIVEELKRCLSSSS